MSNPGTDDFLRDALDSLYDSDAVRYVMVAWIPGREHRPATRSVSLDNLEQLRWARTIINKYLDELEDQHNSHD